MEPKGNFNDGSGPILRLIPSGFGAKDTLKKPVQYSENICPIVEVYKGSERY